jgi:hypothetical protein
MTIDRIIAIIVFFLRLDAGFSDSRAMLHSGCCGDA